MSLSLQEMSAKVDTLSSQVDDKEKEHKDAMDKMDEKHKTAMYDMDKKNHDAMDEKEKDAKKAMDDEKEKHDAVLKAVLKAMDEEDKDERASLLKAAMDISHKDDEHTETAKTADHLKDEENKAMKAQLDYQDTIIKKPKLQILEAAYTNAGVEKETVEGYKADWNKMSLPDLDKAINLAKPIIELSGKVIETPTPLGLSQGLSTFTGSIKSGNEEFSAKVDKMSLEELFT